MDRRLKKAETAVRGLTPPPGPGRSQFSTGWELEQAVKAVLAEQGVEGLLTVTWERRETSRTRYVGSGRGGPNRPQTTEWSVRYQITTVTRDDAAIERLVARMGWQVQVTNAAASRLSLEDSVLGYRAGTCVERAFHQLKDQPLGIRPLFVHRDDQVRGLTHLLTLALRVLTLFEVRIRRGQDQSGEELAGLYPVQAGRGRRIVRRHSGCWRRSRREGDDPDAGGERSRESLASDDPSGPGKASAGLPRPLRGDIHSISH